ncbi:MAG: acetamidase/formamidase family protein [Phycisphaerales bacterium]
MKPIDFISSRFHYSFAAHRPTLKVRPGTSLRVTCPDCDNALADGALLPAEQRLIDAPGTLEGNPLAGPIYLEGAEPGDTLSVRIDAIELDRELGLTLLAPRHGLLDDCQVSSPESDKESAQPRDTPRHMYRWSIDTKAGTATITNPLGGERISVPLNPFIGSIGVSPPHDGRITSLHCGASGGNYDLPIIKPGVTMYLPVNHPGALLLMGDLHAAQGHGEAIGGGIETSGKILCTLGVMKGVAITHCRVRDATTLWAIGMHDDLRLAIRDAYAELLDWVAPTGTAYRYDMYNLLSQAAQVVVGNLNEAPYPAAAGIAIDCLPAAAKEAISVWLK